MAGRVSGAIRRLPLGSPVTFRTCWYRGNQNRTVAPDVYVFRYSIYILYI